MNNLNNNRIDITQNINIIQDIINRLSVTGILIKAIISIIVSSLIISISIISIEYKININNIYILFLPYILLLYLDVYYLAMEKIFRKISSDISKNKFENQKNIDINSIIKKQIRNIDGKYFIKSLFSPTNILFHSAMIMFILSIISLFH